MNVRTIPFDKLAGLIVEQAKAGVQCLKEERIDSLCNRGFFHANIASGIVIKLSEGVDLIHGHLLLILSRKIAQVYATRKEAFIDLGGIPRISWDEAMNVMLGRPIVVRDREHHKSVADLVEQLGITPVKEKQQAHTTKEIQEALSKQNYARIDQLLKGLSIPFGRLSYDAEKKEIVIDISHARWVQPSHTTFLKGLAKLEGIGKTKVVCEYAISSRMDAKCESDLLKLCFKSGTELRREAERLFLHFANFEQLGDPDARALSLLLQRIEFILDLCPLSPDQQAFTDHHWIHIPKHFTGDKRRQVHNFYATILAKLISSVEESPRSFMDLLLIFFKTEIFWFTFVQLYEQGILDKPLFSSANLQGAWYGWKELPDTATELFKEKFKEVTPLELHYLLVPDSLGVQEEQDPRHSSDGSESIRLKLHPMPSTKDELLFAEVPQSTFQPVAKMWKHSAAKLLTRPPKEFTRKTPLSPLIVLETLDRRMQYNAYDRDQGADQFTDVALTLANAAVEGKEEFTLEGYLFSQIEVPADENLLAQLLRRRDHVTGLTDFLLPGVINPSYANIQVLIELVEEALKRKIVGDDES